MKAHEHPAYDSSLRRAALRAWESREEGLSYPSYRPPCLSVYFDGEAMFVRDSKAAPPKNAELVCVAQHFTGTSVQLRFSGAHSEWVNF